MKDSILKLRITEEEVNKFKEVCESKGKGMSEVLRSFISSYTNSENLVLLDIDKETLDGCREVCKNKKIKFIDLIKKLLQKEIKKV